MHIPENYLSPATCGVMTVAMVPVWYHAVRKVKEEVPKEKMPLLGAGAAFSFLMMMFNVPLPGGTTGHAVGGTLIALLFGPNAACIAVTIALLIQALLFGDGGILSFGANCFNMAFILPFVGYGVSHWIRTHVHGAKGEYAGVAIGSYLGINAAAFLAALEFGIQPLLFTDAAGQALYCPYGLNVSIPAMMIPHLLVAGVVELLFTCAIYSYVKKVSPGLLYDQTGSTKPVKKAPVYALVAGLICLTPLGLLASGTAWGEWGSEEISSVINNGQALGYTPKGLESGFSFQSLMPDYSVGALPEVIGYLLSAAAGVALVIIFFKIISSVMKDNNHGKTANI